MENGGPIPVCQQVAMTSSCVPNCSRFRIQYTSLYPKNINSGYFRDIDFSLYSSLLCLDCRICTPFSCRTYVGRCEFLCISGAEVLVVYSIGTEPVSMSSCWVVLLKFYRQVGFASSAFFLACCAWHGDSAEVQSVRGVHSRWVGSFLHIASSHTGTIWCRTCEQHFCLTALWADTAIKLLVTLAQLESMVSASQSKLGKVSTSRVHSLVVN